MALVNRSLTYHRYCTLVNRKATLLRKRMAREHRLNTEPQPNTSRPINNVRDEDEVPRTLYSYKAKEVVTLKIVFTGNDLKPDQCQRFFKPTMVHQVFGPSESIYGYRNLSVDIYYMANSARCYIDLKYNEIVHPVRGLRPDDVFEKLKPWVPIQYFSDKRRFVRALNTENHTKMYGKIVDNFQIQNALDQTNYSYVITSCSVSEPGFKEFHSRFECFIVWSIDAASHIDVDDPSWMFIYVYESRKQPNGRRGAYYPVGYCTVYKFFHFPDKVRARISQVYVIPPVQRLGIGTKLLNAAYKVIGEVPNVIDMTVEDPCLEFTHLRDMLDCKLVLNLNCFKYPAIMNGYTGQMYQQANRHYKVNKRQSRRVYEILRMSYSIRHNNTEDYNRLYEEIKTRLEAPYLREQKAVQKKKLDPSSFQGCVYQPAEMLRLIKRNTDSYVHEIKYIAYKFRLKYLQ